MSQTVNIHIDGKQHSITPGVHPFADLAGLVGQHTRTITTHAVQLIQARVLALRSGNTVTITKDNVSYQKPASPQDVAEVADYEKALAANPSPKHVTVNGNDSVNIVGGETYTSVQG